MERMKAHGLWTVVGLVIGLFVVGSSLALAGNRFSPGPDNAQVYAMGKRPQTDTGKATYQCPKCKMASEKPGTCPMCRIPLKKITAKPAQGS